MYRRIMFVMLLGFFMVSGLLLTVLLDLTGIITLKETTNEHHIYLLGNSLDSDSLAKAEVADLADSHLKPFLYAGHSSPNQEGEIMDRGKHYDSMLSFFGLKQVEWSPGHQSHGYYGIDVSHWQNLIDWNQLKVDTLPHAIDFVLIKATQGPGMVDHYFKRNWDAAKKLGIIKGAYHFYQYKEPPLDQANNYIQSVSLETGDILPILDVELDCTGCSRPEISNTLLIKNLRIYLEAIEKHYKVQPILYTYEAFYHSYLKGHFDDYPYWMAKFSNKPPPEFMVLPDTAAIIPEILMWQFTDSGKIAGIAGKVDMSFLPAFQRDRIFLD